MKEVYLRIIKRFWSVEHTQDALATLTRSSQSTGGPEHCLVHAGQSSWMKYEVVRIKSRGEAAEEWEGIWGECAVEFYGFTLQRHILLSRCQIEPLSSLPFITFGIREERHWSSIQEEEVFSPRTSLATGLGDKLFGFDLCKNWRKEIGDVKHLLIVSGNWEIQD
jgi:hypothetical protein